MGTPQCFFGHPLKGDNFLDFLIAFLEIKTLNHCTCVLLDSSTLIYWRSPDVILWVSGLLCRFYSIFEGKAC